MATCREPLGLEPFGLEFMAERLGAERPQGRTTGMRIDSEGVLSDKESRIYEGLWAKETDPPASPELAMAGRYNKLLYAFTGSGFTVQGYLPVCALHGNKPFVDLAYMPENT